MRYTSTLLDQLAYEITQKAQTLGVIEPGDTLRISGAYGGYDLHYQRAGESGVNDRFLGGAGGYLPARELGMRMRGVLSVLDAQLYPQPRR